MGWLQPKEQSFTTGEFDLGYLVDFKMGWEVMDNTTIWIKVLSKTPGWVAGNEYLKSHSSISAGLAFEF